MKNLPQSREAAKVWDENSIAREVVDSALCLHRDLGPGLLESVYEVLLADDLERRGLRVERQVVVPYYLPCKGFLICKYRTYVLL